MRHLTRRTGCAARRRRTQAPGGERRGCAAGEEAGAGAEADGRDGPAAHRRQQSADRGQPEQGALRHRAHTRPVRRVTRARARRVARAGLRGRGGARVPAARHGPLARASELGGGAAGERAHACVSIVQAHAMARKLAGQCRPDSTPRAHVRPPAKHRGLWPACLQQLRLAERRSPRQALTSRRQCSSAAIGAREEAYGAHSGAVSAVHITWLKAWLCVGTSAVAGRSLVAWQQKFAGTGLSGPVQSSTLSLPAVRGVG